MVGFSSPSSTTTSFPFCCLLCCFDGAMVMTPSLQTEENREELQRLWWEEQNQESSLEISLKENRKHRITAKRNSIHSICHYRSLGAPYKQVSANFSPKYQHPAIPALPLNSVGSGYNWLQLTHTIQPLHLPRLRTEIQEQQNLLKTYEVMVKNFQSQIQNKDSEILELQQQIQEALLKRAKLEKKLKQRGLLSKELVDSEEDSAFFSTELTPNLFSSAVEAAYKSIHDFSKPLINLMKAAGWDLDDVANAIQTNVIYAKRAHKKYAFESYICEQMFDGFVDECYTVKDEGLVVSKDGFFHQYLALRVMDPLDILSQSPNSMFGKFCRSKYLLVIHPKIEASFFGNQDQRNYVAGGGHLRTPFYQAFFKLAKSAWLLHRLAFAFEPKVTVFKVKNGDEFSEVYVESGEKCDYW